MAHRVPNRISLAVAAMPLILATCDANLLGPAGVEEISLAFRGDTLLALGRTVRPEVEVRYGGDALSAPRLLLASSDSDIVDITPTGELSLRRLGAATITIVLEGTLLPASPPRLDQAIHVVAESLTVSATSLTLEALGSTGVVTATAWDANGEEIDGAPLRWESADPAVVAVTQDGLVRATGVGSTQVRVRLGGDTMIVSVSVAPQITGYTLTPEEVALDAFGASDTLTATPRDANGNALPTTAENTPIWVSRDPTTADVTAGGIVTGRRNSTTYIVAHRGGIADSVRLTVNQTARTVVISSPNGFAIDALNGQIELSALGFDRNSNADGNSLPTWASLNPVVAQVDAQRGVVVGRAIGTAQIVATIDAGADTVLVTVSNAPAELHLEPPVVAMTSVHDTIQLTVSATNSRGAPVQVTPTWRSTDTTVVRIVPGGRIEARAAGFARVIATAGSLADTTHVTVTNDPVVVNIIPTEAPLTWVGMAAVPAATIRNARGDTLPRSAVEWRTADAAVATVTASGTIVARQVGATMIRAFAGNVIDSVRVTVTNDPVAIVANAERDTLTAVGRTILYSAEVRNGGGAVLPGFQVGWMSTSVAVATVTSAGVVTAMGPGNAMIIGQAGSAADTIMVTVRNPSLLWVDNSVVVQERFGTLSRPYARIQDAVVAADAGDTVMVRRGFGYAESLALSRRIALIGDSAAYVAGGRSPSLLPQIAHDSGAAGITANTSAQLSIRYFALTHSLDGPAINTSGADVRIDHFYVNPGAGSARIGRGILVRDAPTFAILADISVRSVRGYGIRLERVTQGQIDRASINGVDSIAGTRGAGIDLYRGSLHDVRVSAVRETQGPGVLLDSTSAGSVTDSDFTGRTVLIRVRGAVTAMTVIERNRFDATLQPGATDIRGSANDGRSSLEIGSSSNVQVRDNVFLETGSSLMDAIRLIQVRGGGPFAGATLFRNRFTGGRHSVRSERSSWSMSESRSEGAVLPITATDGDTLQLVNDTLVNATSDACVSSTANIARVEITGGLYASCSAGTVGGRAIRVSGTGNITLIVRSARLGGPNQTGIEFNGRDLTVRDNIISGAGTRTVGSFTAGAVIDAISGNSVTISGNTVADYPGLTGMLIDANGRVVIDSNIVARNRIGVHLLDWPFTSTGIDNDFSDHEVAAVLNDELSSFTAGSSWWGSGAGPRPAAPASVGDSVGPRVDVGSFRTTPFFQGSVAWAIRMMRGNGQTAPRRAVLPIPFTVRVIDASGRPVAGAVVTFTVTAGNGDMGGSSTRNVTSDASGLAEVVFTLGSSGGTNSVRASVAGVATTVTFTATGT